MYNIVEKLDIKSLIIARSFILTVTVKAEVGNLPGLYCFSASGSASPRGKVDNSSWTPRRKSDVTTV